MEITTLLQRPGRRRMLALLSLVLLTVFSATRIPAVVAKQQASSSSTGSGAVPDPHAARCFTLRKRKKLNKRLGTVVTVVSMTVAFQMLFGCYSESKPIQAARDVQVVNSESKPIQAARADQVVNEEIIIDTGFRPDFDRAPLQQLSRVLKENTESRRFRLIWDMSYGSSYYSGTAVYDRQEKTVKLFYRGGMGVQPEQREHILYTGVTEEIIHKAAQKYNQEAQADADFTNLPSFGCAEKRLL